MGGSKSAKGGPNPLADMDRGGSKSASGYGPGGPNPRGSKIRCDTGSQDRGHATLPITLCCDKDQLKVGNFCAKTSKRKIEKDQK